MSVDDTFAMLWDLTENQDQYSSIFDQPSFSYLKELHEKYGAVYSLYCYYQQIMADGVVHTLAEVTGEYCKEFEMNSDWLRLSFHAMDDIAYQNQKKKLSVTKKHCKNCAVLRVVTLWTLVLYGWTAMPEAVI